MNITFIQSSVVTGVLLGALAVAVIALLILICTRIYARKTKLEIGAELSSIHKELSRQISDSVQSRFITIAPNSESMVEVSTEIWRLSKRLAKVESLLDEDQNKALQNSLSKLERFMAKNDLSVTEYTLQKYNPGMNLDVLTIEKDPDIKESIIKETVEPTVVYRGQVLKRAKVIIVEQ